jgi:hypothetical protein
MKITFGEYEEIYSGTVIGIKNEPIVFQFPSDKASLRFTINFIKDDSVKGAFIKTNILENIALEIYLINFEDSMGAGNVEPLKIGYLGNRDLFINFRASYINGISHTLHYTFFLGKEGSHGTN